MPLENLSQRLQEVFKKIRGKGKLTEKDVQESMRDIKLALLEADVNFKVVKDLINRITDDCIGSGILESLTPEQQVIKIMNEKLTQILGEKENALVVSNIPPSVIMMVGSQGTGKTSTTAKLGGFLKNQGKRPLLCACDIYRPAAVEQLIKVGGQIGVPVFSLEGKSANTIAKEAIVKAKLDGNDVVIIDTAGRFQIDVDLMNELTLIKETVDPVEILLVVDAMTGQNAAEIAQAFDCKLGLTGVILTKLDGDARGGAALSVRAVTGKPIKFIGTGERMNDLEIFHPDRMSSRILGKGDILTLIEKAEQTIDTRKAIELEKKLMSEQFTYEDFAEQIEQLQKIGPIQDIISMLPGIDAKTLANVDIDNKKLGHTLAIIGSMTDSERKNKERLTASRRQRIARGSGVSVSSVNDLVKQFGQMQKMFREFSGNNKGGSNRKNKFAKRKFNLPFDF